MFWMAKDMMKSYKSYLFDIDAQAGGNHGSKLASLQEGSEMQWFSDFFDVRHCELNSLSPGCLI